jgi:hypothetical protein
MVQFKQKKSFGPQGNAKVTLGKNVVRINLDGELFELPLSAWDEKRPAGDYNLTLGRNLDKIVQLRPPSPSTHIVRFKEFGNRTNEIPEPKIQRGGPRQSKTGGRYIEEDKLVFTALYEICDGSQYDGLCLVDVLTYGFEPEQGSKFSIITTNKARDLERIETFLRCAGFDLIGTDIPYSPNVLPWLEEAIKAHSTPFMVTTNEQGFIDTRSPVPSHLIPQAAKKAAKKGSKK